LNLAGGSLLAAGIAAFIWLGKRNITQPASKQPKQLEQKQLQASLPQIHEV
jgi:hypothetical protein